MTTEISDQNKTEALSKLVETAKSTRLSPAEETESAGLLKELLLSGKTGIASAVESITNLPWSSGVDAITQAWPELKATSRKLLITGLAAQNTEQGRRFRLSLGRGILNHDTATALKLIEAVCTEMKSAENGEPSQKDRQIFANVLIGKGRPWLLHLPITDLKPAAADKIVYCAVATCFPGQCPPLTQLSVLRWIAAAGRLAKQPTPLLETIAKAVGRWHPKLKAELKKDIPELPAPIEESLKAAPVQEQKIALLAAEKPEPPRRVEHVRKQEPHTPTKPATAGFDLVSTLRQIEAHVNSLKSELNQAKTELRQLRDQPNRHGRDRSRKPMQTPEPTEGQVEEIQRHNRQLEETITELRQRLEDLTSNHEDIATSMHAHDETPLDDAKEQFKALLGIKLRGDYAEFKTLAGEPVDEVYREPFRLLLNDVFEILENLGVVLKETEC